MIPRARFRPALAAVPALAALLLAGAAPSRPPIGLVETVPVETALGNPALPAARAVWLEMIRGARASLDLEEFYLSTWPGEALDEVLAAIGEAAQRRVRVRLLLDAGMHRTYPMPADSLGRLPGIQVRLLDMKPRGGGVQHSKFFLVDGREVYLGSQNLDWRALTHIHELGVRIRDARVASVFTDVFEMDWAAAGGEPLPEPTDRPGTLELPFRIAQAPGDTVLLWPSASPRSFMPDTTIWDLDALVRVLDSARGEIAAQVLTYGTGGRGGAGDRLDRALRAAATRGTRVRLIVSDWEKGREDMAALQSLDSLRNVEVRISTVPEWSGGYIPYARVEHCKYAVVDTAAVWIGTSNWEPGYFTGSRNVAVTLRNSGLARQARAVFEASWRSPTAGPLPRATRGAPRRHGEEPPPGVRKYGG